MSTISLSFDVHTRNWPRIDFQPLEFNFEFYFWSCFFFLGGGGGRFAEFQRRVKIVRYPYQAQNLFKITKKSFKINILTEIRFISLKKKPTKMH